MTKKPAFWIVFALVSLLLGGFAARHFSDAFPIVSLDLDMDRGAALAQAERLATEHGWGPQGFRQASSFGLEGGVQSYVELEGGGKEAFGEMIRGDLYSPYRWRVRHFLPGETTETRVVFTPAGRPYGFREILPEDEPGASLGEEAARRIAEDTATGGWQVDLAGFEPVEASQEARPGGRTDHTFVYERPGLRVGEEGRYRLRLTVSGDRVTELTHFVKVPEAFARRFEEMRSANNAIALVAGVVMLVLFLGVGCGVGLFYLFRQRWVIWKTPLAWGLFVAFLQLLAGLNQWPLAWMTYDTAVSQLNFVLLFLGGQVAGFVVYVLFFSLIFMAAESLTRRAFPDHVQLWRSWSPEVAGSPQVLGRTVAGYLLIGGFFAYEVVLYFVSHRMLGWWSPSNPLYDPDFLATYMPWVTVIAVSLQAGFWEECLFRAVPLAGAALLGRRFGHARWWIGAALLLQAVVFAAAHANYPTQPAYARVVELIPPAIGFGLVYLRFGLLAVVVLHFAYDVVWFALPIFASGAPGAWRQQAVVVAVTLVPLLVVLAGRWKSSRWRPVGEDSYNRSWAPAAPATAQDEPEALPARAGLSPRLRAALLAAGALGLAAWIFSQPFVSHAPRIEIGRAAAVEAAEKALEERGVELSEPWKRLSEVQASTDGAHRFVWQRAGEAAYRELLGRYLVDPRWQVRFARFEGDVAERAEEYRVSVSGRGEVTRVVHLLPEGRAGADLPEDEARTLAHRALEERYAYDVSELEEVSGVAAKQPARRDWTFTFKDTQSFNLEGAEARVTVGIAGDEVAHSGRFIHLPEQWERDERNRSSLLLGVQIASAVVFMLGFFAAIVMAVIRWTRRKFAIGMFLRFAGLVFVLSAVALANGVPESLAALSTAQPFLLQVAMLAVGGLIGVCVLALGIGFSVGLVHGYGDLCAPASGAAAVLPGLALGTAAAGLAAAARRLAPATEPTWADFGDAGSALPLLGSALGPLTAFVTGSTIFLLIFLAVDAATRRWSRRQGLFGALFLALGPVLAGTTGDVSTVALWLLAGAVQGALLLAAYVLVLRHDLTLVPAAVAAAIVLGTLGDAVVKAHPAALTGGLVGIVLVGLVAAYWFRALRTSS